MLESLPELTIRPPSTFGSKIMFYLHTQLDKIYKYEICEQFISKLYALREASL